MRAPDITIGAEVAVTPPDWNEHSRTPRYVGDRVGAVSEDYGRHLLPSSVVRGQPVTERLFSVQFEAEQLFGSGDHRVHVDLYESALRLNHGR
jgi:hypothetical protein